MNSKPNAIKHLCFAILRLAVVLFSGMPACSQFLSNNSVGGATNILSQGFAPDTETSLPISYFDPDKALIFAPDSANLIPVVIFSDGLPLSDDIQPADSDGDGDWDNVYLVVSTDASAFAMSSVPQQQSLLSWRRAYAAPASVSQVCPITSRGQVECFFDPQNVSPQSLFLALSDADGNLLSEAQEENVQSQLFYVRAEQSDLTVFENHLYALTNDIGVDVLSDTTSETRAVQGDYAQNYKAFAAPGTGFVYDSANKYFGLLNSALGIAILEKDSDDVFATLSLQTNSEATEYTTFRAVSDTIYYGIAENTDDEAYIYNLYESTSHYSEILFDRVYEPILFITKGDLDQNGVQLTHSRTRAFDVNAQGYAGIIYENGDEALCLRVSNSENRFGTQKPIESNFADDFDLIDFQFFADDRALLLDAKNQKLWLVFVEPDKSFVTQNLSMSVAIGKGAVKLVLNADKSRAYVLNGTDETVTVVQLTNSDGSPRYQPTVAATYNLSAALPDKKNLALQPNTLALTSATLFVGSTATKAILQVPLTNIVETLAPDEDFDKDGYTAAEGDCADNDAQIHPAAMEFCSDSVDNNCDGTTNEGCAEPTDEVSDEFVF